jgi:hypothetical protein
LAAMDATTDINNRSNDEQLYYIARKKNPVIAIHNKEPKLQKKHLSGSFKLSGCQHIGHSLLRCDLQVPQTTTIEH